MAATPSFVIIVVALSLQTPTGWEATYQRVLQLRLDDKAPEAIVVLEGVLKSSPGFEPARYELAEAHRDLALEAALKGPSQEATKRRELELAAADYRRVAAGTSEYKQLAAMKLMLVYGEDELNRPAELIPFARQYTQISPDSAMGHVTLARALMATGQESAATAALLAARTAVRTEDGQLLATAIVDYVFKTKTSSTADLKTLVDWADGTLDRLLKQDPKDRQLLQTKAGSALFRAERLETDPARKRAAKAEADRAFDKFSDTNPNRGVPPPAIDLSSIPPPPPPPPPMPPGYEEASRDYEKLIAGKQYAPAAAVWEKLIKSHPAFPPPHYLRATALLLAGQRPAAEAAIKAARTSMGATPEARLMAATYLNDTVSANTAMAGADAKLFLVEARFLVDEALQKNPKYWEAVFYKSLIVRTQAKYETDKAAVKTLNAEADQLQAQANKMRPK